MKGSVRIIYSSQELPPFNEATLDYLLELHPSAPQDALLPPAPQENEARFHTIVTEESVKRTLMEFSSSTSAGPDGLRPGHLKALLGSATAAAGGKLATALTNLMNLVLEGGIPNEIFLLSFMRLFSKFLVYPKPVEFLLNFLICYDWS